MQSVPPPTSRSRSWILLTLFAASTLACQDNVAAPDQPTQKIAERRVHPDCIEGCWGPELDVELSHVTFQGYIQNDTLYLPDSTTVHPPYRTLTFEVGPNTADTAITAATSPDYSCSNNCLQLASPDEDGSTSPNPLSLDSEESGDVYVYIDTVSPGSGWLSLAVGAGYEQVPVVVFHCVHRSLESC